jgi:aquaporin Z
MRLMSRTLHEHWPEYIIEAWGLGTFMISASLFGTLLFAPASLFSTVIASDSARRACMGIAMGLTALGIVVSPWGRRSGAHINPAFTLTYWRLGKVAHWDAVFYIVAQFVGGLAGVLLMVPLLGRPFTQAPVRYVVTVPGPWGEGVALIGELVIALVTMTVVLNLATRPRLAPFTPYAVALLVATWATFESPYSGFGMNPARTVASALPADDWTALWLYIVSPIAGMLIAAELFRSVGEAADTLGRDLCAKIYHDATFFCAHARPHEGSSRRCIFCRDRVRAG